MPHVVRPRRALREESVLNCFREFRNLPTDGFFFVVVRSAWVRARAMNSGF